MSWSRWSAPHLPLASPAERANELVTVVSPELMRFGYVWVPAELRWYRRRVTMVLLKGMGITGTLAQRAVEVRVCVCVGGEVGC